MADIDLTSVVADDYDIGEEVVGFDAGPQRAFDGDQHRIWIDPLSTEIPSLSRRTFRVA